MNKEEIKLRARCSVTGKPMTTSAKVNFIQLPYRASWDYPKWGNFLSGQEDMALAICHDEVIGLDGSINGEILEAVEFTGSEIIYHPVTELEREEITPVDEDNEAFAEEMLRTIYSDEEPQRCHKCGCNNDAACWHADFGNCWWVETDLCSHCELVPGEAVRHPEALRWEAENKEQG